MGRFLRLLVVLLPLGLFVLVLQPVQELMFGGQATRGIVLLLAALALLALAEGLMFRYWILPGWCGKVAERLYAGSYLPGQDALACLIDRIEQTGDCSLLPALQQLVRQQPRRSRGWLALARFRHQLQGDPAGALETLEQATTFISSPEDTALLLFRAGKLCETGLHDNARARDYWQRAATTCPATAYGRKAAEKAASCG